MATRYGAKRKPNYKTAALVRDGITRLRADGRPHDTGLIRPYRPAPPDFRETYLRMGWNGITDHYRTNDRCIARWIEECGGEELRQARSEVSGHPVKPQHRRAVTGVKPSQVEA